jgi:XTP/dITP diphosphohydrolase
MLPTGVRVLSLADLGLPSPEETGTSYAENARLKAVAASSASGFLALADDSGLSVDALAGAPGVRSARFGGEPSSDERNRHALLAALSGVEPARRSARFVCALALARAGRIVAETEGTSEGSIAAEPKGDRGFGYDPVFVLPDGRRMAELDPIQKNQVSHRAQAMRFLQLFLLRELRLPSPRKDDP